MTDERDEIIVTPQTPVTPVAPVAATPVAPVAAAPVAAAPVAAAVVAAPVAAAPVVAAQPVQAVVPAPASTVSATSIRRFTPDSIVAAVVGLALTLIGLIAITRAGIDDPINDPVVEVLGLNHTATLGLIEVVLGVGLLFSGAFRSRGGAVFFGTILGIAGFVGAVQTDSFVESLALESSYAWILVIAGVIVVLSALLIPRTFTRTQTVSTL